MKVMGSGEGVKRRIWRQQAPKAPQHDDRTIVAARQTDSPRRLFIWMTLLPAVLRLNLSW